MSVLIFFKIIFKNLKIISSKHSTLVFMIKLIPTVAISYFLNWHKTQSSSDISSGKNLLHSTMRHFTFALRFLVMNVFLIEEFFRRKNFEKFNVESLEIKKNLYREFLHEISLKIIKKISIRRKVLISFVVFFHEFIFFLQTKERTVDAFIIIIRLYRGYINCMMTFKFCYFADFMSLHLMALVDVVNGEYIETSNSDKLTVKRILTIRKCYVHLINMQNLLLKSIKWTTLVHFVLMMMSILRRTYKLYTVLNSEQPMKDSICKIIFLLCLLLRTIDRNGHQKLKFRKFKFINFNEIVMSSSM